MGGQLLSNRMALLHGSNAWVWRLVIAPNATFPRLDPVWLSVSVGAVRDGGARVADARSKSRVLSGTLTGTRYSVDLPLLPWDKYAKPIDGEQQEAGGVATASFENRNERHFVI